MKITSLERKVTSVTTTIKFDGKTYHFPKIWAMSDNHHGHSAIISFCNRPFSSVEEMDSSIIQNINSHVGINDLLIFCGDFCYWKKEHAALFDHYMGRIYCSNLYFVFGNHDYKIREHIEKHKKVKWAGDLLHCEINSVARAFCHYPMATWYKSNRGSIHYHGHTHNTPFDCVSGTQNRKNICVEMTDYKPVEIV